MYINTMKKNLTKLKNPAKNIALFVSAIAAAFFMLAPAHAQEENNVAVSLVADHSVVTPGQSFYLALRLDHKKDWHTYWKNPGDSGQAIKVNWQQVSGAKVGAVQWPTPVVIPTPPLVTYGYKGDVLLPVKVSVPADMPSGTNLTFKADFKAEAEWLECKDICLPASIEISHQIQVGNQRTQAPAWHSKIRQTVKRNLPQEATDWQQSAVYGEDKIQLSFRPPQAFKYQNFRFLPFESGVMDNSAPQKQTYNKADNTYTLLLERDTFLKNTPSPLEGILAYTQGGERKSVVFSAEAKAGLVNQVPGGSVAETGFILALVLAFVGGLILNLMPCVLPVLAIKITQMVQHVKQEAPWHHGAAFAAGVVATFWLLAGSLLALQAAGHALGWGFQLQNPVFVLFIATVLLLVALDLMGVFEIGAGLTRLGGAGQHIKGKTGSFLTGVLATIVATPCTAPFMGTALAFTLGKDSATVLAVFSFLGLGLAAPYVLLTLFPRLLSAIPQPGPWMVRFKQILAFPVLATVVWLLWVAGGQVGVDGIFIVLVVLLTVAFAAWLWGAYGQGLDKTRRQAWSAFLIAALLVVGALYFGGSTVQNLSDNYTKESSLSYNALPFEPGLAEKLQQEGTGVFVVFTADWCITCKVNERLVIHTPEVQKAFADNNIQMIVADWTRKDDAISNALKKHGRAGVPFYLYYPPTADAAPIPLPELLTKDIVFATINNQRVK